MTTKRKDSGPREIALLAVVLLAAVLVVQFDEVLGAFFTRYAAAVAFVAVAMCTAAIVWTLIYGGHTGDDVRRRELPQTWTRSLDREPGCDLCGAPGTTFACDDHQLLLCTGCTQRHDARYRCNIRYVPAVHELQGGRA